MCSLQANDKNSNWPEVSSQQKLSATGILLAGGKSSRMGKNKAFLELGGQTLIEHSLGVLDQTFAEVLISGDQALYGNCGFAVVPDQHREQGPLAGLEAGLEKARFDWCFFAACDMPFLDGRGIRFLYDFVSGHDIVAPDSERGVHPLHAFYHRRCLNVIKANLQSGRRRILDIYPHCQVRYVTEEELAGRGLSQRLFTNVNTPEEWAALNHREE